MAYQAFTLEFLGSDQPQQLVRCSGRLTAAAGADHPAWVQLVEGCPGELQLDLSAVCRIDAAGVGRLAELCTAVHRRGGKVQLVAASDRVRTMLRITGVDLAFDRPTPPARVMPFRNRSFPSPAPRLASPSAPAKGPASECCRCAQAAV